MRLLNALFSVCVLVVAIIYLGCSAGGNNPNIPGVGTIDDILHAFPGGVVLLGSESGESCTLCAEVGFSAKLRALGTGETVPTVSGTTDAFVLPAEITQSTDGVPWFNVYDVNGNKAPDPDDAVGMTLTWQLAGSTTATSDNTSLDLQFLGVQDKVGVVRGFNRSSPETLDIGFGISSNGFVGASLNVTTGVLSTYPLNSTGAPFTSTPVNTTGTVHDLAWTGVATGTNYLYFVWTKDPSGTPAEATPNAYRMPFTGATPGTIETITTETSGGFGQCDWTLDGEFGICLGFSNLNPFRVIRSTGVATNLSPTHKCTRVAFTDDLETPSTGVMALGACGTSSPGGDLFFSDGFESGSTHAWSLGYDSPGDKIITVSGVGRPSSPTGFARSPITGGIAGTPTELSTIRDRQPYVAYNEQGTLNGSSSGPDVAHNLILWDASGGSDPVTDASDEAFQLFTYNLGNQTAGAGAFDSVGNMATCGLYGDDLFNIHCIFQSSNLQFGFVWGKSSTADTVTGLDFYTPHWGATSLSNGDVFECDGSKKVGRTGSALGFQSECAKMITLGTAFKGNGFAVTASGTSRKIFFAGSSSGTTRLFRRDLTCPADGSTCTEGALKELYDSGSSTATIRVHDAARNTVDGVTATTVAFSQEDSGVVKAGMATEEKATGNGFFTGLVTAGLPTFTEIRTMDVSIRNTNWGPAPTSPGTKTTAVVLFSASVGSGDREWYSFSHFTGSSSTDFSSPSAGLSLGEPFDAASARGAYSFNVWDIPFRGDCPDASEIPPP